MRLRPGQRVRVLLRERYGSCDRRRSGLAFAGWGAGGELELAALEAGHRGTSERIVLLPCQQTPEQAAQLPRCRGRRDLWSPAPRTKSACRAALGSVGCRSVGADPEGFVDFYRRDHPAAAGMPMWRTGSGDVAAGLISELSTSALIPGAGSGTVVANEGLGTVCRHGTSVGLRLRAKTRDHQP